jgi:hypothetical protein
VVFAWFRLLVTALDGTLMFGAFVLASTNVALRPFCALSEVVAATALHTHLAFSSFPEPLCFVSSAAERQAFRQNGIRGVFGLHSQDEC